MSKRKCSNYVFGCLHENLDPRSVREHVIMCTASGERLARLEKSRGEKDEARLASEAKGAGKGQGQRDYA